MNFVYQTWQLWLLFALLCAIAEVLLPMFKLAFASVAATSAGIVAVFYSWPYQVGTFAVLSLGLLAFLRPRLLQRLHVHHHMPSRSQELVGKHGVVTDAVDANGGRVEVAGQDWSARSEQRIAMGKIVTVIGHDGIVLIIKEN